ncbi:MAG: DUF4386 family protein [Deltaproteobacteria bacterium]|jgi:hypothetical protein
MNRHTTAALVVLTHAILLVVAFFVLAAVFEFPDILREPPAHILAVFRASRHLVVPTYWVFTMTGVTFIAMAVAVSGVVPSRTAHTTGVLAGLTQAFGFIRWVWLVPALAATATDPGASDASRDAALVVFEAMHQFAGVSVGEHLSFLFQGVWTIAVGVALVRDERFSRGLGYAGVATGAAFVVYTLEQFGGVFAGLGQLNVVFHVAWLAWLALLATTLLKAARRPDDAFVPVGRRAVAFVAGGATLLLLAATVGVA